MMKKISGTLCSNNHATGGDSSIFDVSLVQGSTSDSERIAVILLIGDVTVGIFLSGSLLVAVHVSGSVTIVEDINMVLPFRVVGIYNVRPIGPVTLPVDHSVLPCRSEVALVAGVECGFDLIAVNLRCREIILVVTLEYQWPSEWTKDGITEKGEAALQTFYPVVFRCQVRSSCTNITNCF
jgi:hypothetical protein